MNKTMKKVLSLVLVTLMVVSIVPMNVFAANIICSTTGLHRLDWVTTTEATCTADGEQIWKCTRDGCDYTTGQTQKITKLDHVSTTIPAKAPTCEDVGNTAGSSCKVCGTILTACETIPALGHTSEKVEAIKATCTTDGQKAGTVCSVCGETLSGCEVIKKTDHKFVLDEFKASTCTTQGYEKYYCSNDNCNETKTEIIEAAHSFGSWTETKKATCTSDGTMTRECKKCDHKEVKIIEAVPHTEKTVALKPATCEEPGRTAGKICSECEVIIEGCQEIPATGHTEKVIEGTPATCTEKGTTDFVYCSVCNEIITDIKEIKALGHIMVDDKENSYDSTCTKDGASVKKCSREGCTYKEVEVIPASHNFTSFTEIPATCTKDGKKTGFCSKCKATVEQAIPATGHKIVNEANWKTTKNATCTTDGEESNTCSVCKKTVTRVIPATGHTETTYKPAVEATCENVGYTESKWCSVCKTVTVESKEIPKTDHSYGEWTVEKNATCAAGGVEKAVCSVCKKTEYRNVDRLPHTEKEIPAVAATCTTPGSTAGIECTVCGAKVKEVDEIPALGHTWVADETLSVPATCTTDGRDVATCSVCGENKDEVIKAEGHKEEVIAGSPADCTLSGVSDSKKCTVCGEITVEPEQIPALGHDLVLDTEKSVPASCTQAGTNYYKCSRCQFEDSDVAPMLEHTWGEWEIIKEASCEAQGEQRRTCSVCNTVEDGVIESLGGHQIVTLPGYDATCTTAGKTNGTYCEVCNTIFEAQEDIPAFGHDIVDAEYVLTPATTENDGSYALHCKVCDEPVDPVVIPKIASVKLSTSKCTYNGKKRTPSIIAKDANGVELEKGTDFEVEYEAGRKDVGQYNIKVTFLGNYEGTVNLTFTIAAAKTAKITATSAQKDYVKISWSKVTGATGYRVYVYNDTETKTRKKVASVTGTSYNLKKDYYGEALEIGSEYKVAVVAYTKLDDGTVIHALAGVAKTFTRTPGKPSVSVTSSSGKATIKWTDISGETGYQIWYSTSKDGTYKKLKSITEADKTSYSKSFTKGKTIYFKVRAYTKVDGDPVFGLYSDVKSVKIK